MAWLAAVENGLDDVRSEIAEANEPSKIGWAHALPLGECRKRHTVAADKSCVEPARLDQQLNQPSIGFCCRKWVSSVYPQLSLPDRRSSTGTERIWVSSSTALASAA